MCSLWITIAVPSRNYIASLFHDLIVLAPVMTLGLLYAYCLNAIESTLKISLKN